MLFIFTAANNSPAEELIFQEVKICGKSVNYGDKVVLGYKDLHKRKVEIKGKALDGVDIQYIEISNDAGESWEKARGITPWEYDFIPETAKEYTFLAHAVNKDGGKSSNFIAVILPDTQELISTFERIFKEMRNVYIDERLREFLKFFDQDHYPHFIGFTENMENTFDQSSNFNLKIVIRNVAALGDTALVRVDWIRTFEDVSRDSGANNIIRFHKIDGLWKIFDIEDEKIFIVGTGTFRGNITDR